MKPRFITLMPLVLAALSIWLLSGCKSKAKLEKDEISKFVSDFKHKLKAGNTDSLMACFEGRQNKKTINKLIKMFAGKTGLDESGEVAFQIEINPASPTDITIVNDELAQALIGVTFKAKGVSTRRTSMTLKIHQVASHKFKITELGVTDFLKDYVAYENVVRNWIYKDEDIYSPITLKAFEVAKTLKPAYDTVIYFSHINNKTFFYVAKKKTIADKEAAPADSGEYSLKRGLLNPALKEIIPPEYDVVYSINGTFKGLVEVEKSHKRGFYNLDGKAIVPSVYDQIFPINDPDNLAILRKDDDYFYLKNDTTVSEKADLKASDFITKIKCFGKSFVLEAPEGKDVMECNSRESHEQVCILPSYLADLNMIRSSYMMYDNPLRHQVDLPFEDIKFDARFVNRRTNEKSNWIETAFYYLKDHFLGDRTDLYISKQVIVADKKRNRVMGVQMDTDYSNSELGDKTPSGICNENSIKMLNDSLYEIKTTALFETSLHDNKEMGGGPFYHYITIKDGKLVELPGKRKFNFTKYVKMDESYLSGCYEIDKRATGHVSEEMLRYAKNEIYAEYGYQFKDPKWISIFDTNEYGYVNGDLKPNVDDSLTVIDKYNIDWINKRLQKKSQNALAAK